MTRIEPRSRTRYSRARHSGDINIKPKAGTPEALSKEIVPVVGTWTDADGTTGGTKTKKQMMFAGRTDRLQYRDAWLQGGRDKPRNTLGTNKQTTRLRDTKIYIIPDENKTKKTNKTKN